MYSVGAKPWHSATSLWRKHMRLFCRDKELVRGEKFDSLHARIVAMFRRFPSMHLLQVTDSSHGHLVGESTSIHGKNVEPTDATGTAWPARNGLEGTCRFLALPHRPTCVAVLPLLTLLHGILASFFSAKPLKLQPECQGYYQGQWYMISSTGLTC